MTDVLLEEPPAGGVALVRFSGEARLNAFGRHTWEQLDGMLAELERDADVRAVVLTGTGRAFVAGADINEYVDVDLDTFTDYQRLAGRVTARLTALDKPTVAAVNGYALGGGFELMLACDMVVAATSASFGLPEVKLGLLPGGGGTQRLPRRVGPARAKELIMTGRTFDARQASTLGLVNALADVEELLDRAVALAAEIATQAPLAVRLAKRLVDDGLELPLGEAIALEAQQMPTLFDSEDGREGVRAFIDKRAPRFVGR